MHDALFQPFPMARGREAQVWRHQPAYRRPRHFHEEPEINLVVRGTARVGIGDRTFELSAGELILFEPGQDHVLLEASADLELFVLALRPPLAARVQGERSFVLGGKLSLDPSELEFHRDRALAASETQDSIAIETILVDLFSSIAARPRMSDVSSRRAVGQLRVAPHLSGAELGKRLRISESRISREFHRDLGLTMVEYRARLRLMRFIRLVDAGSKLSRAALEADFGSYAQCHRVFQRLLGCGPREYFTGARAHIDAAIEPANHAHDLNAAPAAAPAPHPQT